MENIKLSQERLLELYSEFVLRNNRPPVNVYVFCEEHGFAENEFYHYYAGFEELEADYLRFFLERSVALITADETYAIAQPKVKLLSFYYTFIEQLTLNRSLVLYLLGGRGLELSGVRKLWSLRRDFIQFTKTLHHEPMVNSENNASMRRPRQMKNGAKDELYWNHFVSVIKFWQSDKSRNFEKTDIYIEKSVDTAYEVLNQTPVKKIVDLAKFIFNDKIRPNS